MSIANHKAVPVTIDIAAATRTVLIAINADDFSAMTSTLAVFYSSSNLLCLSTILVLRADCSVLLSQTSAWEFGDCRCSDAIT
jgi:hypothetical protein